MVSLIDGSGKTIGMYNPGGSNVDSAKMLEYELKPNEQLIGFYGSGLVGRNYFKNFGFVARVKNY